VVLSASPTYPHIEKMIPHLLKPWSCKTLSLENRIVMAPMTRKKSPQGVPGPDVAAYYRRRAEGGVGLIITEGTTVDRQAASFDSNIPNIHDPVSIAGWKNVVSEVHAAGGKIFVQLWHAGSLRPMGSGPNPDARSEGPSATTEHIDAMSDEAIADTVESFGRAAATAQQIGFDGVEIHAAHGYLIDQFLWSESNRRTDRYGGTAQGRTRFASEIVKAVRASVGPGYVISLRISQWKLQDYDAKVASNPKELEAILTPLADAGIDIFHGSARRFWDPAFSGSDLSLAGWTREITGLPSITVGSVGLEGGDVIGALRGGPDRATAVSLADVERRMAMGEFDLVAVGRALLVDPLWLQKVRDNRLESLSPFDRSALLTLA
jgi:2,4-dienoyl-CoA reductase-like NADH-dependent reductase (Old Yellow Enzyme family)